MAKPKKTTSKPKKVSKEKNTLFLRDETGICVVTKDFLNSLTFDQAVNLGLITLIELRTILVEDAIANTDTLVDEVKVTVGLNNSLAHLEFNFPDIMQDIRELVTEHVGNNIYIC